ncbi:hypothetical protein E4U17_004737 [Claviceps sp. LM77 group G4]|nr:hypothetical protein E4U17_004737 [Claviceps sp. LM77 group G4]KAG6070754.1 hypothetical protein E4U33_004038 [Claviceps sp. LM78 group G4]KAG6076631.1 hypothetical protein E4U16_002658 [Claviceps sp. LM84 group G4]
MQDPRYDLDPQGDTILVLRCPNTKQPVWEPADEVAKLKKKNKTRRRKLFGLDFMSDTEDGRSDDQNAHEPTPEPIPPTTESNVPNDSGEAHGENSERDVVQFRLSSRHLALASPVFKTMLNGSLKASGSSSGPCNGSAKTRAPLQVGPDCQLRYELTATEWDAEDFLIVMTIVHGKNRQVPVSVDLETLGRISVIVDYYHLQEVVQVVFGLWIFQLRGKLPTTYGRDCVTWIFVSWVVSFTKVFEEMTKIAITTCEGGLGTIYLPFPPMLLSSLEQKRDHFIDEIFNILGNLCKDLWKGCRGCGFECTSMLLDSLMKVMDENELYGVCSAEQAKSAVLSLESEMWKSYSLHNSGSLHVCNVHTLLQPDIERLWAGLDGLKLADHDRQNKTSAEVSARLSATELCAWIAKLGLTHGDLGDPSLGFRGNMSQDSSAN